MTEFLFFAVAQVNLKPAHIGFYYTRARTDDANRFFANSVSDCKRHGGNVMQLLQGEGFGEGPLPSRINVRRA